MESKSTPKHSISSYPKVLALGHPLLDGLFDGWITVQEKYDGSQFSFGVSEDGVLMCRSKGVQINLGDPGSLFKASVEHVKSIKNLLAPGYVYRGEALCSEKHNVLRYGRVPDGHIVLYDVEMSPQRFMPTGGVNEVAFTLGIHPAEAFLESSLGAESVLEHSGLWLESLSSLGGCLIEGFVIKNRSRFGPDGKMLVGKVVSEAFKEKHKVEWKQTNPNSGDILESICKAHSTEARWQKAVQRMKEAGTFTGTPQDIGMLIKMVQADLLEEEKENILRDLWKWAGPHVTRRSTRGLPEWYKAQMASGELREAA